MKILPRIKRYKGTLLALAVSCGLTCCHPNGALETVNADKFRPVYHHAPLYGWMNDVSRLAYKDGVYHLYFQYNPCDSKRENTYWGHSVSKDLVHWEYLEPTTPCDTLKHIFPDDESTDMVELSVDGDTSRKKWALIVNVNPGCSFGGSATQYFIGDFDGTRFSCDSQSTVTKWLDWGKDHYAAVCFSNTEGRTIALSWMNNWQYCHAVPTKQFRSANTLPRELSLYTQDGEVYLSAYPVSETKNLRKESREMPAFAVTNDYHINSLLADNEGAYELALEIASGEAEIMGFSLFNDKGEKVDIYFNLPEKKLVMDRTKSGIVDFGKNSVPHEREAHDRRKTTAINYMDDFALATWAPIKREEKYRLDVFVDKCSVELFLNGGKIAMTNLVFPSEPYNRMCFYSKGGSFNVDLFKVYRLSL